MEFYFTLLDSRTFNLKPFCESIHFYDLPPKVWKEIQEKAVDLNEILVCHVYVDGQKRAVVSSKTSGTHNGYVVFNADSTFNRTQLHVFMWRENEKYSSLFSCETYIEKKRGTLFI